jgi:hypothetical protein
MIYLLEYSEMGPEAVLQLEKMDSEKGKVMVTFCSYSIGESTRIMDGKGWYKYKPISEEEVLIYKMAGK